MKIVRIVNLIIIGLIISGCATVSTYKVQYLGIERYPQSDWKQIVILTEFPQQRYQKLGEIVANVSIEPEPAAEKIEKAIKIRAAELGADAVVLIKDRIEPIGMWLSGPRWGHVASPIYGRIIVGVAIKYLEE